MESTLMETDMFQKFSQQKSTGIRWPQLPLRKKSVTNGRFWPKKKERRKKRMADGRSSWGWPWMSRWKLGSMVRINGLFHLLVNEAFLGGD